MAEVLSQTEIDALLSAVSNGNVETEDKQSPRKPIDWIAYDLTSQEKIVRGRLAALNGIHERFTQVFRQTLSSTFQKNVTVTAANTDFLRFSDCLSNIMLPTSLNVISIPNLKGRLLFVLGSKLTYALVDAYYGGSERPYSKIGGREEFTSIESMMIKKVCQLAMRDLKEAWRVNYPLELEYEREEQNPQFVGAIPASELVAVVTFDIEFDSLSGPLILILQLRPFDTIQEFLSSSNLAEETQDASVWREHWLNELATTPMKVKVELGSLELSIKRVQNFTVGEVLPLTQDAVTPLPVLVEGQAKFKGLMGTVRGNTAIRITDVLPAKSDK